MIEVVLLEEMIGQRSMNKNPPNGEHNLVEWAKTLSRREKKVLSIDVTTSCEDICS
jgi:hypothetical protein